MYRLFAYGCVLGVIVMFTSQVSSAHAGEVHAPTTPAPFAAQCQERVYTYEAGKPQAAEKTTVQEMSTQCENGKHYEIVQVPKPIGCTVESVDYRWRWIKPEYAKYTKAQLANIPGEMEFTPPAAVGAVGTKYTIPCKNGQTVASGDAKKILPLFIKGADEKGVKDLLELQQKKGEDAKKSYLTNTAGSQELLKAYDGKKDPEEWETSEAIRTAQNQALLNELAEEKGIIGKGEAAKKNGELDDALKARLGEYSKPENQMRYYGQSDTPPVPEARTVSAYEEAKLAERAGFVQEDADKTQRYIEYQNAEKAYKDCKKKHTILTGWYCAELANDWRVKAQNLEDVGCEVGWTWVLSHHPTSVSCEESTITTSGTKTDKPSTDTPEIPPRNPARIDAPSPDRTCEKRYPAGGTEYRKCKEGADDGDSRDTSTSAECAALQKACLAHTGAGYNPSCNEHARKCSDAPPPPGYTPPPSGPGYSPPPGSNYNNGSNPYGYNGLNPTEQRMLERECFDYGNSNACSALQRYCQQGQNQNQGSGVIGQIIPLITSLISGGQGGSGQFGQLGGQQNQQCSSLNNSINNSMCRQYRGMQFLNGRCECPSGQKWDGNTCKAENICAQYPGTVLTNGRCECKTGEQWDGAKCAATDGSASAELKAELACAPSVVDVDETPIAISWLCKGADTATGDGFGTVGTTSGSATITLKSEDLNSDATRVDLGLTCTKGAATDKAICPIDVNRPLIVAVATYSTVKIGQTSTIGWIVKGMKEGNDVCKITSNKHPNFSQTGRNVVLTTPMIQETTEFTIRCTTRGGNTKEAKVTIQVAN